MNKVLETIYARRSCKCYDAGKSVSEEDVNAVVKAALCAPTAMNSKAWHFTVVSGRDALQGLNSVVRDGVDEAARKRIEGRSADGNFNFFYGAPVLIIVSCSDASPFPESDCACALENMFLAASSLGLGSCWINQLTRTCDDENIRKFLNILGVPQDNKVYGCCALGYAAKEPAERTVSFSSVNYVK